MRLSDYDVSMASDDVELFMERSQDAVLLIDQHGVVIQVSSAFLKLTGNSQEDVRNKPIHQLIEQSEPLGAWYQSYIEFVDKEEKLPRLNVVLRNGKFLATDYSLFQLKSKQNVLLLIILYDLAGMKGISNLQDFTGTFMKDVNLGVILVDMDFKIVDISDMACKVLGVEKNLVMQLQMDEVFRSVPSEHQLFQRTILDGLVVRNHAISWMNGQERHELLMDSNLLKDRQGRIVGAYVLFKDVSNLRSLEEQVQRSDRLAMIGQIAAGTAHEIRNPLTSIKGFLQVLRKSLLQHGMEKEHGFAEIMLTEIDRINELVNEFLLLSKPKHISYDSVYIPAVLKELLPIINNEAILHDVAIQYHAAYQLPDVVADKELLKQVCLNICKNGIEAMVEGGILTITEKVDMNEHRVNIDIHDTGPGIPSFLIDKIFDPFFTTKENGTGLGLSVCQRIIHDIGGNIRVASKGYGTTFTISIPYS